MFKMGSDANIGQICLADAINAAAIFVRTEAGLFMEVKNDMGVAVVARRDITRC